MKIAFLVPDNRDEFREYSKPEPYFGPAPSAMLEGLAHMPECEIHVVCCTHLPLPSPEKIGANIYFHSSVASSWGWLKSGYIGCVRAVKRMLRQINPDIVHGQGTERYCALAAVRSGFPNVVTIHGNMRAVARLNGARPFSFQWLSARLEGMTLPKTAGVFCNSAYTEELVRPIAKKTWRVPNALREKFFAQAARTEASGVPVLLNIGFVEPRKGQNELLAVAERLFQRKIAFKMLFIGQSDETTPYGARFRELIKQARTRGYADYLGLKTEGELITLMDNASGLVHMPREEAFGLVVAEGLARNLKFFGAKLGGIVDIAAGVDGAELIEGGDLGGLEEAIFAWLKSGFPKPSQAARQMRERYHPDVIAQRHLEIYREVAKSK